MAVTSKQVLASLGPLRSWAMNLPTAGKDGRPLPGDSAQTAVGQLEKLLLQLVASIPEGAPVGDDGEPFDPSELEARLTANEAATATAQETADQMPAWIPPIPTTEQITNIVGEAAPRLIRFYGSVDGKPDAGEELFDIAMTGDERFAAGLPQNIGSVDAAPTSDAEFPIYHNGVQIGAATVLAGTTAMVWTTTADFGPATGDRLRFNAPAPQDATLSGPAYTFAGTRA